MGNRFVRPFPGGNKTEKNPDSSDRLPHQMDRSRTISYRYDITCPKAYMCKKNIVTQFGIPKPIVMDTKK